MTSAVTANGNSGEVQIAEVPITIVQQAPLGHNPNTTTSGPWTVSATLGSTPSASNSLLAVVAGGNITSVAFSSLSWTQDVLCADTEIATVGCWRAQSDGSTETFTATITGSTLSSDLWFLLLEVGGLNNYLASPVDFTHTGIGSGSSNAGSQNLTADTNKLTELVLYLICTEGTAQSTAPAWTGSITTLANGSTGSTATDQCSLFVGYYIASAAYTPSSIPSWATSNNYGIATISYKGNWTQVPPGIVMPQAINVSAVRH